MPMQDKTNKIKVVLFDADGVLFDVTGIHDGVVKELLESLSFSKNLDAERFHKEWDHEDENLQSESSSPDTFLNPPETLARSLIKVLERRNISISMRYAKEIAENTIERFCTLSRLFPETKEVLAILRKKFVLGIISNMSIKATARKLKRVGIGIFFQHIIGPDTVQAYKPALKIFQHALTLYMIEPDGVVFIGDNHRTDIVGATKAGITTILLDRKQQTPHELSPRPDYRITSLIELPELLSSMRSRL
ncbi:MAG: HAD family hydrolase [Candidatus Heimdallarchaeota archaeon]